MPTKFAEAYMRDHAVCPKCFSADIEATTMGYPNWGLAEYHDGNRAICCNPACRWRGTTHDLVPKPAEQEK